MNLLDLTALAASSALYYSPTAALDETPDVPTSESNSAAVPAAEFVLAETRAMPTYLKLGFTLCALAFNLLALLTARGVFCRLPAPRRLRVIALWERISGPSAQFTDFFRLMARF